MHNFIPNLFTNDISCEHMITSRTVGPVSYSFLKEHNARGKLLVAFILLLPAQVVVRSPLQQAETRNGDRSKSR